MDIILMPNEIEMYIDSMRPQNMLNLGTDQWMEWHNRLQKLHQEALLEAAALSGEHVKETLVSFGKTNILVHEIILISIWKHKVLPHLLKLVKRPECTFFAYSILYHEGVCVALLELVMFHSDCCEALDEVAVDLLDYVSVAVSKLLNQQTEESANQELIQQRNKISFDIGIRCLTILFYLAENVDKLPITVCSRLYAAYDVPVLLSEIILKRPWVKNDGNIYSGGKWRKWDNEQLPQVEAQVWLTLRQTLLSQEGHQYYSITANRRSQLTKILPMMNPILLDQLSPLFELKNWLCRVSCLQEYAPPIKPVFVEAILEIKEKILQECQSKWKSIAKKQALIIFTNNKEKIQQTAKMLTEAYNTDFMEKFEVNESQTCVQCNKTAVQRCSRCKKCWYCSRRCQVNHWPQHKENCSQ
ncbi:zinc finger MYND domain-containing protein 10 [Cylas formicarius]|uniref:zinc finger MYND domain-containing protein 10 n=1 Tax=Cylas formicarius TaxID=197179 RepID=UPI0029587A6E|nr:zinc finger MYND domain-containing protein 10 [Cylas formicarius]